MGFSSIRVWVAQPCHQSWCLENKQIYRASGEAQDPRCLYKGIRTPFFTHALFFLYSSIPFRSSPSAQAFVFSAHKGFPKMSGSEGGGKWMAFTLREKDIKRLWGRVFGQENWPPSSDGGTDHPHSRTPREGGIPPSFCPYSLHS